MLHFIIFTGPARIDMDAERRLPYFLWSTSRTCGVGLNVGYCYLRVRAGILGVSIAFFCAASPLGQATKASCCMLPVGPFLLHLFLIQVLHDFALWRFQRGGNSRLNVNKISLPLAQDKPAAASTLDCKSAGPVQCGALCRKERCQPWFCHYLAALDDVLHALQWQHKWQIGNFQRSFKLCNVMQECGVYLLCPLCHAALPFLWSCRLPSHVLAPIAPSAIKN